MTNLIKVAIFATLFFLTYFGTTSAAYAACEQNYGGGETCTYNKRFDIDKDVRIEGDNSWKDKVVGVRKNDIIEFRIKIKNTGEVETDNMEMKDYLPDELILVSGDLTEDWNDFDDGETKTFKIKVKIKSSEFDRKNFEKCVVNKAIVKFDGDQEGSDTATVCYGDLEVTELPKTGPEAGILLTIAGIAMISAGFVLRNKTRMF